MKKFKFYLVASVFCFLALAGEPPKKKLDFFSDEEVVPHIAVGGVWTTTLTFLNVGGGAGVFPLRFWTPQGQPWEVFVEGLGRFSEFTISLPAGGSIDLVLPSQEPDIQTGWAEIDQPSATRIAGHAIFADRTEGRPPFEAVVLLTTWRDNQFMLPFDNSGGNNTCMALANSSQFNPTTVSLDFTDQDANRLLLSSKDLAARNQTAFCFADFPELAGLRGVLRVVGSELELTALAFRFNPGGAFTTFFTMSEFVHPPL